MKQTKRWLAALLSVVMIIGAMPMTAFAAGVDYNHNGSTSTDEYYNLISKKDWDIAPGISESEIVLNNEAGTRRQVLHVMEADMNSEYTKVIGSYAEMNTSKYQTQTMDLQASWVEENWNLNVVGAMNTCLSWYSGYPADQVGKPLGFMMVDGEILWDECEGFPTVLVINKDKDAEGNERPADIPKVEMVQIKTTDDLDGWEEQVIPCSSGFIVKDGVNQNKANHSDAAPRSVVGIKADGTVVIMENDGRQAPFSTGMSMYELAEVMIDLGCTYAVNCDGGGSSTFLSQRPGEELEVNNSPSDGGLRPTTQGILFISTAPSDGTFVRASVEADAQYYTPNSEVQFTAKGADFAGGAADIPAEATWKLSDSSFGTINQDGLFVSNGKVGEVSAQIEYNGEVVGEFAINVVIPDSIQFSQSTLTVPNGESTTFSVSAKYGNIEVVTKDADFEVVLDSENMGKLDGYKLTATEDTAVLGGSITATLTHDKNITATMQVVYGKASEVIYDFENGVGEDWYVEQEQKRKNWSKTEATSHYNVVVDDYTVTAETGMVHEGEGAAAISLDNSYATLNWAGASLIWANETVTYENVSSIGAWIYFPKDAVSTAVRFMLNGTKNGESVSIDEYPIYFGDSKYFEESGWHYCAVDVSEYDSITLVQAPKFEDVNNNNRYTGFKISFSTQLNGGTSGEYDWTTEPGIQGENTFYIDDIIIDYSEACEDREAPVFGDVKFVEPVTSEDKVLNNQRQETTGTKYNKIGFTVSVKENTNKVNATGLDSSSAKAYIDGNKVECKLTNGIISVDSTELKNGVHTIKFTISDKAGNDSSVIRKINVQADNNDSNIKVVAPEVENNMLFTGSQYWVDVVASEVEKVDEVTLTLDLNNNNTWILDQIETLYGFKTTYKTDVAKENIVYLTIKKTGDVDATGEETLASIPVQTWTWAEEDYPGYYPPAGGDNDLNGNRMYDPYEIWQEYVTWNCDVIVNPLGGNVTYINGTQEWFSGEKIQLDTEQKVGTWWGASATYKTHFEGKSSWHLHVAGEAQSKEATCTETGYKDRVFCVGCACVTEEKLGHKCDSADGCGAVLDWGTIIPATGHKYDFVDGVLECTCGKLFNGVYTDGKTYVEGIVITDGWVGESYYKDGFKLIGVQVIDGKYYNFGENGICANGYPMTAEWWTNDNGESFYFNQGVPLTGYQYVEGNPTNFDNNGVAWDGEIIIDDEICVFEKGVFVESTTADVKLAGLCGPKAYFVLYADGTIKLSGEGNTFDYVTTGSGIGDTKAWKNRPWGRETNALSKSIKKVVVGKDITEIGVYTFYQCFNNKEIVFEEGSKLEKIDGTAFCYNIYLKEVVLPESLKTLAGSVFAYCDNLESVYMPQEISSISSTAFKKSQNVVLNVASGTYAEDYAIANSMEYTVRKYVDSVVASGTCGENATWTFYSNGKLVIDGSGAMTDFAGRDTQPWAEYINDIEAIVIGKDITNIGNYAFAYALNVESVEFEEGSKLEKVGILAFFYQRYLKEVVLPESVTNIGSNAFGYCAKLANIYIPQDVTYIHPEAFKKSGNVNLNVATGSYAHKYAVNKNLAYTERAYIDTVIASGTCGENATWTFYNSGKLAIDGSGAMTDFTGRDTQPWAQYINDIKTIVIGKDITNIGNYAFAYALNVESVEFEEGSKLEKVGILAFFYQRYLKEVVLPESVTYVGSNAFGYCSKLVDVSVPEGAYVHSAAFKNTPYATSN